MAKPNVKIDVKGQKKSETVSKNLIELTEDIKDIQLSIDRHSIERPVLAADDIGYMMFDEVLGKPIWWNGIEWVDALGSSIDSEQ